MPTCREVSAEPGPKLGPQATATDTGANWLAAATFPSLRRKALALRRKGAWISRISISHS
jgi:hypothetical protein